jgi:hypothetical protein
MNVQCRIGSLLLVGMTAACHSPVMTRTTPLPLNRNAVMAAAYGRPEDPRAAAKRAFDLIDTNKDGALSETEYVTAQTSDYKEADAASVRAYLQKQFAKFDRNKDKRLVFAEYIGN